MKLSTFFTSIISAWLPLSTTALQLGSKVHALPQDAHSVSHQHATADMEQTSRQEQERVTYWRYTPKNFIPTKPRYEPAIGGARLEKIIHPGAILKVAKEQQGADGILYLLLAEGGGGWLFDEKPGVGTMCMREAFMDAPAFLEAKAAELRRVGMKANKTESKDGQQATAKAAVEKGAEKTDLTARTKDIVAARLAAVAREKMHEEKKMLGKNTAEEATAIAGQLEAKKEALQQIGNKDAETQLKTGEIETGMDKFIAILPTHESTSSEILSSKSIRMPAGQNRSAQEAAEGKTSPAGPALKHEVNRSEETVASHVTAKAHRRGLGLMQAGVSQGAINLNVTAPELIGAGLKMALPSALTQTSAGKRKMTLCQGGHLPVLLHTGEYTCDLLYAEGSMAYYINSFFKLVIDLYNLSRMMLFFLSIALALVVTFAVEVFIFRRRKGPQYELIETDMSAERPEENSSGWRGMAHAGKQTKDSKESPTSQEPTVGKKFKPWTMTPEPSIVTPDIAETTPARSWGLRQLVQRIIPRFQCRRRRPRAAMPAVQETDKAR